MSRNKNEPTPIIIRKVQEEGEAGHHGGAWKVAYADFVTAMMAFFLLMWLLNATTEDQRKGIADYFDPKVPVSRISAGGEGMFRGTSIFAEERLAQTGTGGSGEKTATGDKDKAPAETDIDGIPHDGETAPQYVLEAGLDPTAASDREDFSDLLALKERIEADVSEQDPSDLLAQHLRFTLSDLGLRIDIVDEDGRPLFESASSKPTPQLQMILSIVASVLGDVDNDLSLSGHTDQVPFKQSDDYTNWELSTDRALAARRFLEAQGLAGEKFAWVEGRADRDLLEGEDPNSPRNRRIAITVLSPEAKRL